MRVSLIGIGTVIRTGQVIETGTLIGTGKVKERKGNGKQLGAVQ